MEINRRDFLKTILALGTGALGIGASGCVTGAGGPVYGRSNFFICNYWVDRDQDGETALNEFVGIKNQFRANESVTLVGILIGHQGSRLTTRLYNGENRLVNTDNMTLPFESSVYKLEFGPWELVNKGGQGLYQVQWYINDNMVNVNKFNIIK